MPKTVKDASLWILIPSTRYLYHCFLFLTRETVTSYLNFMLPTVLAINNCLSIRVTVFPDVSFIIMLLFNRPEDGNPLPWLSIQLFNPTSDTFLKHIRRI